MFFCFRCVRSAKHFINIYTGKEIQYYLDLDSYARAVIIIGTDFVGIGYGANGNTVKRAKVKTYEKPNLVDLKVVNALYRAVYGRNFYPKQARKPPLLSANFQYQCDNLCKNGGEKMYLKYPKNEPFCKENENYRLMQSNCAQQTIRVVDQALKSFFALLNLAKKGKYDYKKIRMPKYRQKGGLFNYIIQGNSISIRDGYWTIQLSREYKDRYFKIAYCYEIEEENLQLNQENTLAIDIGLDNLATCVTNTGTAFIMDGRRIKSINQSWNKQKAKFQSILSKQNMCTSEKLQRITNKRNNRVEDYLKKVARYIVKYCIENDIGTIVCGYNSDFKREIDLSKRTNQQFVQVSYGKLRSQLKCLCDRYSMKYEEQEESYTSKASFLDFDEIPVYQADSQGKYNFSGRRIYRGLYRSKDGKIINSKLLMNPPLQIAAGISKRNYCVKMEIKTITGLELTDIKKVTI